MNSTTRQNTNFPYDQFDAEGNPIDSTPAWFDHHANIATQFSPCDLQEQHRRSESAALLQACGFVGDLPLQLKNSLDKNPHFLRNLDLANDLPLEDEELNDQSKPAPKPAQNSPETHSNPAPGGFRRDQRAASDRHASASSTDSTSRPKRAPSRGPVSLLNQLPSATQDKILDLLDSQSYADVAETIAKPEPEGFNLTVSIDALKRFYKVHKVRREAEHLKNLRDAARALLESAENNDDLSAASMQLVKMRLLEKASISAEFSLPQLYQLARMLYNQRMADLAERRLHLAEKKMTKNP